MSESTDFKRSPCAIANTLDIVGDKWSLLVVRDLLLGKRTYSELAASPEGIPTNILAERLKRLESAGIITSAAYQDRPVRYAYTLTKKGTALGDVILAMVRWGKEHIPGTRADGGRG
jgi:DNA-binding HxlR family transcriptional regulator